MKSGDILGFSGRSFVSDFVNVATLGLPRWSISHVGILAEYKGELLLIESTTLDGLPCVIQGKPFSGVQAHRLDDVVRAYQGRVWEYPIFRPLYDFESKRLSEFLVSKVGTPYDELGAFRTGGVGLSFAEGLLRAENLSSIFCSELVAKAYAEIGLHATDNASRWNPNKLLRELRRHEIVLKPLRLK